MSYKNITIEDKEGTKYYPITSIDNIKLNESINENLGNIITNIKKDLNNKADTEDIYNLTNKINNLEDEVVYEYMFDEKMKDKADKSEVDKVKQSGVETNKILVDALNSNGIMASTENNIKENSKKINKLKIDRNWNLKNLNPDSLFEDLSLWRGSGPVNLSVENNVLIIEAGIDSNLYGFETFKEDIELDTNKIYNISFCIKKTNTNEETIISFTNENLVDSFKCDSITKYIEGDKYTRYSYNFKPTQSGKHSLSIYSKNAKKGDKIYIKELMICESEEDELFVPPIRKYDIGSRIKTNNIKDVRNQDKDYKILAKANIYMSSNNPYAFDSEYNLYVLRSSFSSSFIKKYNSQGQFIKDIEFDIINDSFIHEFGILNNNTFIITTTNRKVYNIKEDGTVLWEKSYQFPMKRILISRKEDYLYITGYMNTLDKYNYSGRLILSRGTSYAIEHAIMSKDEYKYLSHYNGPYIRLFSKEDKFLKDFKLEKSNDNIKKFKTNNNNDLLFLTKENNIYVLDETAENNSRLVLKSDEKINDFIVDNYNNLYVAYDTGVIRQYTFNKLNWEINDLSSLGINKIFFGKDNLLYVACEQNNFYIIDYPLRVIEKLIIK